MLKSIFGTNPSIWIESKQFVDEVNGFWRDTLPLFVICSILALLYIFDYLFIVSSVEWWIPAQQNVQYNSYTPQVTFFIIRIIEYLWRYIIWRSIFLLHLLTWIKNARGSEVNYSYFRIILVSVQQQILWLQVPMNYVSLMTVIYCRQYLRYYLGCVSLTKVLLLGYLIKQLSAIAKPNQ